MRDHQRDPSSTELESLLRLLSLDRLPRAGWIQAGLPEAESVGAHALGAALIVLGLGPRVEPPLDVDRAVALALVHDAPEALLGDLPRDGARHLPPGAKAAAEDGAARELLGPLSPTALARFREYREQATREARFARLCDKLQLGVRAVAYRRAGARGLGSFRDTVAEQDCAEFPPCAVLQRAVLAALDRAPPDV